MSGKVKVTVVGSGYVGMSLAVLLAQHNKVTILEIDVGRVKAVNPKESTVADPDIEIFLQQKTLELSATTDKLEAYADADFVIVATPTNYDPVTNYFDTGSVDLVVSHALRLANKALVIIKSTVLVGHTHLLQERHCSDKVIFSPEFLQEGLALRDNLWPSRIILGCSEEFGTRFANLLRAAAEKQNIDTLFTPST